MAAKQIDYVYADGTFTVTGEDDVSHDLTTMLLPGALTLAYDRANDMPALRIALLAPKFVVTLPSGQPLTFDKRTAIALDRLGWTVPRAGTAA
jgi:hypothetical protein